MEPERDDDDERALEEGERDLPELLPRRELDRARELERPPLRELRLRVCVAMHKQTASKPQPAIGTSPVCSHFNQRAPKRHLMKFICAATGPGSDSSFHRTPFDLPMFSARDEHLHRSSVVDVDDLQAVINNWGECNDPADCPADIAPSGGNGIVNVDDLLAVINAWGECG